MISTVVYDGRVSHGSKVSLYTRAFDLAVGIAILDQKTEKKSKQSTNRLKIIINEHYL